VFDIATHQTATFIYQYLHDMLPRNFNDYFTLSNPVYPSRNSNTFYCRFYRLKNSQRFIKYMGPKVWNSLPDDIKNKPTEPTQTQVPLVVFQVGKTYATAICMIEVKAYTYCILLILLLCFDT